MCIYINFIDINESTSLELASGYKWTPAHDMQGKKRIKNLFPLLNNVFPCIR